MSEHFSSLTVNQMPTHILSTDKYKTNSVALYIRQPLEEEHHTKVALIPAILKRGTEHYPTAQKIRQLLDECYGASLEASVVKRGEEQIVVFRLQLANEKFLTDKTPLFEKGIRLLSDILTKPVLEDGAFSKKIVELEKDLLHRKLSQLKDDKIRYANKRCVEEMFKEEKFRLFVNGSQEQLAHISAQDLYDYYQQMLHSHLMELFVVGDVELTAVKGVIDKNLSLPRRQLISIPETAINHQMQKEQEIIEKTKIAQGKLHIGCRTHTAYGDSDYIALLVCNGIFGGFSHSKLFVNVREKESLAYYVTSSIESHKGMMMIMAGIEFTHYQKTVSIIKDQLMQVTEGHISEDELSQTKAVLINQICEANDQPFLTMEHYFHGIIGGIQRTTEQLIEEIEQVSIEDVKAVAQKIEIDTVYFLTSEDGEVQS